MPSDIAQPIVRQEEYWYVEKYDRDLECEHRDVLDDGTLEPCTLEAEYIAQVPMFGATSRTRYCSIHLWDSIERWIEGVDDDATHVRCNNCRDVHTVARTRDFDVQGGVGI